MTNTTLAKLREAALKEAEHVWPDADLTNLRFHCDNCHMVDICDCAYDLYNAYGSDIINTGCLAEK